MTSSFPDLQGIAFSRDSVSALLAVYGFLPEDVRESVENFILFGNDADKKHKRNVGCAFILDERMPSAFPDLQDVKFSKDSVSAFAAVHRFLPEDIRENMERFIFFGNVDQQSHRSVELASAWNKRAQSTVFDCLKHGFLWNDRILLQIVDRDFDMSFCAALLSSYEIGGKTTNAPLSDHILFKIGEKAASFDFLGEMNEIENGKRYEESLFGVFLGNMMRVLYFLGHANFARACSCCNSNHLLKFSDICVAAHSEARKRAVRAIREGRRSDCDFVPTLFDEILSNSHIDARLKLRLAEGALENGFCSPSILFEHEFDELGEQRIVFLEGFVRDGREAFQKYGWEIPGILAGNKAKIGADLFARVLEASLRASFMETTEDAQRGYKDISLCPRWVLHLLSKVEFDADDVETFVECFSSFSHAVPPMPTSTGLILDAVMKYNRYALENLSPRIFFDNVVALAECFCVGIPGDEEIIRYLEACAAESKSNSKKPALEAKSRLTVFLALGADHIDPNEWKSLLKEHPSEFEGALAFSLAKGWFGRRRKFLDILSAMGNIENFPAAICYPGLEPLKRTVKELRAALDQGDGLPEGFLEILGGPLSRWMKNLATYPPSADEDRRAIRNAFEEVSGIVAARMAKMAEEEMADGVVL